MGVETKIAVSVAEMARMVGLSRARFYQLMGNAFPTPVYDVATKRPYYDEDAQKLCLEVRRRNCGIDGKPVLFYCRRAPVSLPARKKIDALPKPTRNHDLLDGVKALGLVVAQTQVDAAVKSLFPRGIDGVDPGEVVRAVFIHLKAKGA